jgi:quercetin dioxygenase-like cupin family protein
MKPAPLFVACLVGLAIAGTGSASASDSRAASDPLANHVFALPQSAGNGEGKEVSVLLDTRHLKLATVVLRGGSALPSHRAHVPTTILVLEGEGIIHLGNEAVTVSRGTLVALAGNEDHDVVPRPDSDMILLVHYLRMADEPDHSD